MKFRDCRLSQCNKYLKMRTLFIIFAIFALSITVSGNDTTPKNTIESNILELLRTWRAGGKGPFSFPLPTLEEIQLPAVSGNYAGYGVKLSYETREMKLVGLKNFTVEMLDASDVYLSAMAKITAPILTVSSDYYSLKGKAYWVVPINGSGKMSIHLKDIEMTIAIQLTRTETGTQVDSLQLDYKIGSIESDLENASSAINTVINLSAPKILKRYYGDIVNAAREMMIPVIDAFLENMTPNDLFHTLGKARRSVPILLRFYPWSSK